MTDASSHVRSQRAPDTTRELARALARAMETEDPSVIEPYLHSDVFLWYRELPGRDVQHGRSMVAMTLAVLHARCTPTRISVYRVVEGTAVLSAFAGERAIWSAEVVFRGPLADAFSLSVSDSAGVPVFAP